MKKILLTGYKGFIGSHLDHVLMVKGYDVVRYEWGEDLPSFTDVDWCIHCGAISSTIESDVEKIKLQNLDFSKWLYNECCQRGINFQFSSSASVYGLGTRFHESESSPVNEYAKSKYEFEQHVLREKSDIVTHMFRYFNVYGSGEDHKGKQASPYTQFTKQAKETGKIQVFQGSDKYKRDFVPVELVVDTHLKFLKVFQSGLWNVGTGESKSFLTVAKEVQRDVPCDIEFIRFPEELRSHYQKYTCADITRIKQTLSHYGLKYGCN